MKNTRKLIIIFLSTFLLLTAGIASWYILSLNYLEVYDLKNILQIVTQIGFVGAIMPALTISLIYYLILKIEHKLLLLFLMIILIVFLMMQVYWIGLNLLFYHIDDTKSFLGSLLEAFEV
jgi:hypothetical protein